MVDTAVLETVALTALGLAAAGLVLLFGHALLDTVRHRRRRPRVRAARSAVQGALQGEGLADAEEALRALPVRLRAEIVVEVAVNLLGQQRAQLAVLAGQAGVSRAAEQWCGSSRWWLRLRGVRVLAVLGGGERSVPSRFHDRHAVVRAAAAWWVAANPTTASIWWLLHALDDPARVCRFAAQDALTRVGRPAVGPVGEYLESAEAPRLDAALAVAAGVADPTHLAAALRLCAHPGPTVRARAADLAGAVGGPEAAQRLTSLLSDADGSVRAVAAQRLAALGHWPAAPRLAEALEDPVWEVRRAAALGLLQLGAPGVIYLRRATEGDDRFAADLARQILDYERMLGTP